MTTRVFIVDDDKDMGEIIQQTLGAAGMETHFTSDSAQAAARLQREKFDAVFLDMRMPAPDGIEVAKRVRASGPNQRTPIIMITGARDLKALQAAFLAGADFFLFKPLDRKRLLRLIQASEASIRREKRRFQRVPVRRRVTLQSSEGKLAGTTVDLSLNGLQVEADHTWPAGTSASVSLQLVVDGPPLRMTGRIVRLIGDTAMGIQIEDMGQAEAEDLQEFLLPLILSALREERGGKAMK